MGVATSASLSVETDGGSACMRQPDGSRTTRMVIGEVCNIGPTCTISDWRVVPWR